MEVILAREATNAFGPMIGTARAGPVPIEQHGRGVVVMLAVDQCECLPGMPAARRAVIGPAFALSISCIPGARRYFEFAEQAAMVESILLAGILAEEADAARAHVWTFDHATVFGEIQRRVTNGSNALPTDPIRHACDDNLMLPTEPNDWRAAKLSRILRHFDLRFETQ